MGAYENELGERFIGATYYVSSSGSDESNGLLTSPFNTIQRGIDAAASIPLCMVLNGEVNNPLLSSDPDEDT